MLAVERNRSSQARPHRAGLPRRGRPRNVRSWPLVGRLVAAALVLAALASCGVWLRSEMTAEDVAELSPCVRQRVLARLMMGEITVMTHGETLRHRLACVVK